MAQLTQLDGGSFRLAGELDLGAVAELARKPSPLFPARRTKTESLSGRVLELDLSGITQANTAALALMLDWVARAQAAGGRLVISHWPEAMVRIARFSNVAELIGISASQHQIQTSD